MAIPSGRPKSQRGCIASIATRSTIAAASNRRIETCRDGTQRGFWCCPIAGCDGRGFCFDIFPTDPDWRDEHGERVWVDDKEDLDEADADDKIMDEGDKPNGQVRKPPSPDDFDIPF